MNTQFFTCCQTYIVYNKLSQLIKLFWEFVEEQLDAQITIWATTWRLNYSADCWLGAKACKIWTADSSTACFLIQMMYEYYLSYVGFSLSYNHVSRCLGLMINGKRTLKVKVIGYCFLSRFFFIYFFVERGRGQWCRYKQ